MIEELERLARAATPGPWEAYTDCPGECCWLVHQPERDDDTVAEGVTWPETGEEDARYIAACSPDRVLRLLEVVKQAKALLEPMDECREIARRWEPDDSSGKERQWLVRGRDAAKALRAALAGLEEGQ